MKNRIANNFENSQNTYGNGNGYSLLIRIRLFP